MCDNFSTCSGPKTTTKFCPLRPFVSKKLLKIETEDECYRVTYELHIENQSSTVEPIRLLQIWDSGIYAAATTAVLDQIVTGAPAGEPVPVVSQSVVNSLLPLISIDRLVLGAFVRARIIIKIDKTTCLFNNSLLVRSGDQQPLFPPFYITESIDFKQTICVNGQICRESNLPL